MNKEIPLILFVCEHGSAKSTIAAAHFNELAREQNLNIRAISRGTDSDDAFPDNVTAGLRFDGLEVEESKPKRLSDDDIADALRAGDVLESGQEKVRESQVG